MDFCESGLAASACARAAMEQDKAPINVTPSSKRPPRAKLNVRFILASVEQTPLRFKVTATKGEWDTLRCQIGTLKSGTKTQVNELLADQWELHLVAERRSGISTAPLTRKLPTNPLHFRPP